MNSVVDEGLRLAWDHVDLDAGLDECDGLEAKMKLKSDLQVIDIATAFKQEVFLFQNDLTQWISTLVVPRVPLFTRPTFII